MASSIHEGHHYHVRAFLNIPHRLFRPPNPGVGRVGRVTKLSLAPVYEVKLEDVLAEKHLPPLTLTEFETYLVYTERSPENLHFILWFRDYEKRYKSWTQSSLYPRQSASLAASFSRAQQTFFNPSSPLELNLPAESVAILRNAVPPAHPTPSYFADIRRQVDAMLRESLSNFVRSRSGNVGRNRGFVAIIGGLCVMCIGLVPILLSILGGRSKWLRFAALPLFWFGGTAFVCGLHGLCLLIYIFGDARQLTVYELARPRASKKLLPRSATIPLNGIETLEVSSPEDSFNKPLSRNKTTLLDGISSNVSSHWMSPVDYTQFSPPISFRGMEPVETTNPELSEQKISALIRVSPSHAIEVQHLQHPPARRTSTEAIAPFLSTQLETESPTETTFDFDKLPSRMFHYSEKDRDPRSPSTIAPLSTVLDHISIRTQWDTFARSTTLAFLVACFFVGISFTST